MFHIVALCAHSDPKSFSITLLSKEEHFRATTLYIVNYATKLGGKSQPISEVLASIKGLYLYSNKFFLSLLSTLSNKFEFFLCLLLLVLLFFSHYYSTSVISQLYMLSSCLWLHTMLTPHPDFSTVVIPFNMAFAIQQLPLLP